MIPAYRKAQQRRRERNGLVLVRIGQMTFEVPEAVAHRIAAVLKRFAVE